MFIRLIPAPIIPRRPVSYTHLKEGTSERIAAVRESTREKLAMLTGQLDEIMDKRHKLLSENKCRHFYRRSLLRGNPGAVSTRFSAALKELKEQLEELNH